MNVPAIIPWISGWVGKALLGLITGGVLTIAGLLWEIDGTVRVQNDRIEAAKQHQVHMNESLRDISRTTRDLMVVNERMLSTAENLSRRVDDLIDAVAKLEERDRIQERRIHLLETNVNGVGLGGPYRGE